jgi:hypothetical protein
MKVRWADVACTPASASMQIVKQRWHKNQTVRRNWFIQLARPLTKGGEKLNRENKASLIRCGG